MNKRALSQYSASEYSILPTAAPSLPGNSTGWRPVWASMNQAARVYMSAASDTTCAA